jgi:succinyl-diaminopimelate desuccinylase
MSPTDPVDLAQALIRRPSVTPSDGGALDVLEAALRKLGFACRRLPFEEPGHARVDNLYARLGDKPPHFCFAGHTDVVPIGNPDNWSVDPFAAEIKGERLYGRGAADMKTAIAAFVAAVERFLKARKGKLDGSISFLITGDEEADAVNGTVKMLGWLKEHGEVPDVCLVGEPTNQKTLGETIKIGRRGSLTAALTVFGTQGHSAYAHLADNPIPRLMKMLGALIDKPLDKGNAHFPPSDVIVTTIDVGNTASNLIPSRAEARINIRFNDAHTGASLERLMHQRFDAVGGRYELAVRVSGEAFLTPVGPLARGVAAAVKKVTGREPKFATDGGTSDARFIKDYCPVVEFGMTNETAHKTDENSLVADVRLLADIYEAVIDGYFAPGRR